MTLFDASSPLVLPPGQEETAQRLFAVDPRRALGYRLRSVQIEGDRIRAHYVNLLDRSRAALVLCRAEDGAEEPADHAVDAGETGLRIPSGARAHVELERGESVKIVGARPVRRVHDRAPDEEEGRMARELVGRRVGPRGRLEGPDEVIVIDFRAAPRAPGSGARVPS